MGHWFYQCLMVLWLWGSRVLGFRVLLLRVQVFNGAARGSGRARERWEVTDIGEREEERGKGEGNGREAQVPVWSLVGSLLLVGVFVAFVSLSLPPLPRSPPLPRASTPRCFSHLPVWPSTRSLWPPPCSVLAVRNCCESGVLGGKRCCKVAFVAWRWLLTRSL